MGVVVGSDNGYIFRRKSANKYEVVGRGLPGIGHSIEDEIYYGLHSAYNDPSKVIVLGDTEDTRVVVFSSDGGKTFKSTAQHWPWNAQEDGLYAGAAGFTIPGTSGHPDALTLSTIGIDGVADCVDADGRLYASGQQISDNHFYLFRIKEYPVTIWEKLQDLNALGMTSLQTPLACTAVDGYLWWVAGTSATSIVRLSRLNLDGTNYKFWEFDVSISDNSAFETFSNSGIQTWPSTNRLLVWGTFDSGGIGNPAIGDRRRGIVTIDTTIPDAPGIQCVPTVALPECVYVHFHPITHDICIALVWDFRKSTTGAILRSIDGGLSWTNVTGFNPHMGNALIEHDVGFDNEACGLTLNPSNPNEIWAAGGAPYLFHSTDAGLTWTEEIVDVASTVVETPKEWCSIAYVPDVFTDGTALMHIKF